MDLLRRRLKSSFLYGHRPRRFRRVGVFLCPAWKRHKKGGRSPEPLLHQKHRLNKTTRQAKAQRSTARHRAARTRHEAARTANSNRKAKTSGKRKSERHEKSTPWEKGKQQHRPLPGGTRRAHRERRPPASRSGRTGVPTRGRGEGPPAQAAERGPPELLVGAPDDPVVCLSSGSGKQSVLSVRHVTELLPQSLITVMGTKKPQTSVDVQG